MARRTLKGKCPIFDRIGPFSRDWTVGFVHSPIQSFATDLCLGGFAGVVFTAPCDGSDLQLWERVDLSDGGIIFQNRATGECLDSNTDGDVYTLECNGGSFQTWR